MNLPESEKRDEQTARALGPLDYVDVAEIHNPRPADWQPCGCGPTFTCKTHRDQAVEDFWRRARNLDTLAEYNRAES